VEQPNARPDHLQIRWRDPAHLELRYRDATVDFQAVKYAGIEIAMSELPR